MKPKQGKYHHGGLPDRLLSAAEEIIAEKGLEGLSLRLLSKAIGVSHTATYRHYRSKHDLLCALAQKGFESLQQLVDGISPEDKADPLLLMRVSAGIYITFALDNPARYRVMFGHVLTGRPRTPGLQRAAARVFNSFREIVALGQMARVVRNGDPDELTSIGWSTAHGLVMLLLDGQISISNNGRIAPALASAGVKVERPPTRALINLALESIAAGLAKPPWD